MMITIFLTFCLLSEPLDYEEIKNGINPKGRAITFKLYENLRIGPEKQDERLVWHGKYITIDVDDKGHIFVADSNNNRIVEIDTKGNVVRQIGGPGQGPGEFQFLKSFYFLADGTGIAHENSNFTTILNYYDKQLNYLERKRVNAQYAYSKLIPSPNGELFLAELFEVKENEFLHFVVTDKKLDVMHTVMKNEMEVYNFQRMYESAFWLEFIPSRLQFEARGELGYTVFDKNSNVYTAVGHQYQVTKWDSKMNKLLTFSRKYKPIRQSEDEILAIVEPLKESMVSQVPQIKSIFTQSLLKKTVEKSGFLPRKHPINGLRVTDDGKVLVIHDHSYLTGDSTADIFDERGKYLGSFSHPNSGLLNMIFKKGHAYTLETLEDGEKHLVRYSVQITLR